MIRLEQAEILGEDIAPVFNAPVSLDLQPGRLLGIAGTSGAGKTLILQLISGHLKPDRGLVERDPSPEDMTWIPQDNQLATTLTALENVTVPLVAAGATGADARAHAIAVLETVGLHESTGHLVEELSGGQQQRVAIARALAHPATYLLADEPTSALDAGNRRRVLQLLHEHARSGHAVVVTTNDPDSLESVADDIFHLGDTNIPLGVRESPSP